MLTYVQMGIANLQLRMHGCGGTGCGEAGAGVVSCLLELELKCWDCRDLLVVGKTRRRVQVWSRFVALLKRETV